MTMRPAGSSPTKELITEQRYAKLCDDINTGTFPSDLLDAPHALESEARCFVHKCQTRIRFGYPVEGLGFACTECATVRLIRGLVEVIETLKEGEMGLVAALMHLAGKVDEATRKQDGTLKIDAFGVTVRETILPASHGVEEFRETYKGFVPTNGEPGILKVADPAELSSPFGETLLPVQEGNTYEEGTHAEVAPSVDDDNPNLPADFVAKKDLRDLSMSELLTEVRGMLTPEMAGNPEKPFRQRTRGAYTPPTEQVSVKAGDFSKTGNGVIHIEAGGNKKLNVMDLPPGTILRFDTIKPAAVDRTPLAPGESESPYDKGLIGNRSNQDMTIPEAVARKWDGPMRSKFAVDLSTIPEEDRPLFEGYDTTPIKLGSAADVRRYEQSLGDPALMAMLEEEEDEFIAEQRRLFGDEHVDRMLGLGTNGITRASGGAGTVRTSAPPMTEEAKREASLGTQSTFPSLDRRSRLP
jgi:hypothetical protein